MNDGHLRDLSGVGTTHFDGTQCVIPLTGWSFFFLFRGIDETTRVQKARRRACEIIECVL